MCEEEKLPRKAREAFWVQRQNIFISQLKSPKTVTKPRGSEESVPPLKRTMFPMWCLWSQDCIFPGNPLQGIFLISHWNPRQKPQLSVCMYCDGKSRIPKPRVPALIHVTDQKQRAATAAVTVPLVLWSLKENKRGIFRIRAGWFPPYRFIPLPLKHFLPAAERFMDLLSGVQLLLISSAKGTDGHTSLKTWES